MDSPKIIDTMQAEILLLSHFFVVANSSWQANDIFNLLVKANTTADKVKGYADMVAEDGTL